MRQLDIGEVARRSGVPASTLRYYEEKGLIASSGRHGLRRLFDAGVLERLALIGLGRAAGLSLDEIAGMGAADGALRIDRAAACGMPRPVRRASTWTARRSAACCGPLPRGPSSHAGKRPAHSKTAGRPGTPALPAGREARRCGAPVRQRFRPCCARSACGRSR
jgi:hypothetical protein